ncbi:MAG: thiolase family protein [Pseudomonadota bacterium]
MSITKYREKTPQGNRKPVIIDGARSPFVKSFGVFEDSDSLELFSRVVDGLLRKVAIDAQQIDEIIAGVVIPQTKNPNVARDTILNLGLPLHIHGSTLNRACTSSLQAIADAAKTISFGHPSFIVAGGIEVLSDVPIVYSKEARKFLVKLSKAKSTAAKLEIIGKFSAKAWLPKSPELTEPMTGLTMGEHAEIMAKLNHISRRDQDQFAVMSHQKASKAQDAGFLAQEIIPIWPGPKFEVCIDSDNIIRKDTNIEGISNLKPVFDRKYGTLTAANSSPLTDGSAAVLIGDEEVALRLGLKPKARILDFDFVGVDPADQLLIGPAITIPRILNRNQLTLDDIDRFEIHEAFAAQVLSCLRSLESKDFAEKWFGQSKAYGSVPEEKLNVNGGALAIGHPFGATGARLVTSLTYELERSKKRLGLIAICAAGGMAASILIERIEG